MTDGGQEERIQAYEITLNDWKMFPKLQKLNEEENKMSFYPNEDTFVYTLLQKDSIKLPTFTGSPMISNGDSIYNHCFSSYMDATCGQAACNTYVFYITDVAIYGTVIQTGPDN
ncbi:hypothetical protein CN918_31145 [Priestia megaterium]|nr:hypothetical protein CN918_31145 [Priestia megaterium]